MKLEFLIQGSQPEPYRVTFERSGDNLTAKCTCPAGVMRQHCKHRLNLMAGDVTDLVSGNIEEAATLPEMIKGTDVEATLEKLQLAEAVFEVAKKEVAMAKKAIARSMED